MQSSASSDSPRPRRRKRRDQACEPCRKAKTRCDHTIPICLRCQRKGSSVNCIYVPTNSRTRIPTPATSISDVNILNEIDPVEDVTITPDGPAKSLGKSNAFFGPTSFSASFLENRNNFESDLDSQAEGEVKSPITAIPTSTALDDHSLGIKILSQLPSQVICEKLMEKYNEKTMEYAFHKPTNLYCMKSFWETFGDSLKEPRRPQKLQAIAHLLTKNTSLPFVDADDGKSWLASLSGQNFRWEMLGLLFCVLGITATKLKSKENAHFFDTQPAHQKNRFGFALQMNDSAEGCIEICSKIDIMNIVLVSLLWKSNTLYSLCAGDTSFKIWRRHGEVIHAATGLGLHHRPNDPQSTVSTSLEIKRRVFGAMFANDSILSCFTGRPPGISYRYNSCPLPLDLSDEILLADNDDLQAAARQLDDQGWNVTGEVFITSRVRASCLYAAITDEVLEISLGNDAQFSKARLLDIKHRMDQLEEQLPHWLRLSNITSTVSTDKDWIQTTLKFNILQCKIILEQVWVKRANGDKQQLLDVARQLLSMTVKMFTGKDTFLQFYTESDWIIICYGIPSAGVLCLELLSKMETPHLPHPHLPRSEVIQNLSLLVGFLDWARPTAANSELCGRMQQIIKRTLDKILDGPVAATAPPGPKDATGTSNAVMDMEFGPVVMNDLDWLNTIDWVTGPFVDMGNGMEMEGYSQFL